MNENISRALKNGRVTIFLGAGCSMSSSDKNGKNLPSGNEFVKELMQAFELKETKKENIKDITGYLKRNNSSEFNDFLFNRLSNITPSHEYLKLVNLPIRRIYNINIDDALENACTIQKRNKRVLERGCKIIDADPTFSELQIIKLNGCVNFNVERTIFSKDDYTQELIENSPWYRQLSTDFHSECLVFIGTTLDEPIFEYHIKRYDSISSGSTKAYLIVPDIDYIEKDNLESKNIEHISGTLNDFVNWAERIHLDPNEVALNRTPTLKLISAQNFGTNKILETILVVNRAQIIKDYADYSREAVRKFYKGFKPTWIDINDNIYADIHYLNDSITKIKSSLEEDIGLFLLSGPAGSGKSTILKAMALYLSDNGALVYYSDSDDVDDMKESIRFLQRSTHGRRFYFFIDKIDHIRNEISRGFNRKEFHNCTIVSAIQTRNLSLIKLERPEEYYLIDIDTITRSDASKILLKLEQHGPFHHLHHLNENERVNLLLEKSKRQLLIGLLEATTGEGYKGIIKNEYESLEPDAQNLLNIVCMATANRMSIKIALVTRSLNHLGITSSIKDLSLSLSGIIQIDNDAISVRHQTYAEEIHHLAHNNIKFNCLVSIVKSICDENIPVSKYQSRHNSNLYKRIMNYKFIKRVFKNDESFIRKFYSNFEKKLEIDSQFWLHYGLSLRYLNSQEEALEKLGIAYVLHPGGYQIAHAFAQQELIQADRIVCERKTDALNLLESSLARLNVYDSLRNHETEYYNMVAAAEFEVAITFKANGHHDAISCANKHIKTLNDNKGKNQRVMKAFERLIKFVQTGKIFTIDYKQGSI